MLHHFDMVDYAARRMADDTYFHTNCALCERPITNLVERYGLAGKSVLSIGAGDGFEEYWMARAGCRLTLVDIATGAPTYFAKPGADRYFVSDADTFISSAAETFDVVYASSFHPDEIRRGEVQRNFQHRSGTLSRVIFGTWPPGTEPYSATLVNAFRLAKPGGLLIFQHYYGSPCPIESPFYLSAVAAQFRAYGAELVEAHTTRKPSNLLHIVAGRFDRAAAKRMRPALSAPLRSFHGRYPDRAVTADPMRCYPRSIETVTAAAIKLAGRASRELRQRLRRAVPHV